MSFSPVSATYTIRIRDNNRVLKDGIAGYRKLGIIKLFNKMSSWALELDATDPIATLLTQPGWGIQVLRTLRSTLTGQVLASTIEISGNMQGFQRTKAGETLTVHGWDDTAVLAKVQAYPVVTYPYQTDVLAIPNIARFWRINDAVGASTVHDYSTFASNGTPTAVTFGKAAGMDDPTAFAGRFVPGTFSKIVHTTTTGLPTGNGAWSISMRARMIAFPTTGNFMCLMQLGNCAAAWDGVLIFCDEFGEFKVEPNGNTQGDLFLPVVNIGDWHTFGFTYNPTGSLVTSYFDGEPMGTQTYQAMTLVAGLTVGAQWMSGTTYQNYASMDANACSVFTRTLTDAEMQVLHSTAISRFNHSAYDYQTGVAETVMRHYVDLNAISAIADPNGLSRVVPGLSLETNLSRGTTVSDQARFEKLILKDGTGILQRIALNGGLGFSVIQSGTSLKFHVYVPTDRSATVRFSDELGSVLDYTFGVEGPDPETGMNQIAVGGGGTDINRLFVFVSDGVSLPLWGRIEGFQDARDTSDVPTLQGRGAATLATSGAQTSFSATVAQTQDSVYGLNFFLGDIVNTIIDGVAFADVIQEVDITLDQGQGEVVVPVVGTPSADYIWSETSRLRMANQKLHARLAALETRH
jgi:hypothetical protein